MSHASSNNTSSSVVSNTTLPKNNIKRTQPIIFKGVDSINEKQQITILQVICFENRDLCFMVEMLDGHKGRKYLCPKTHFFESDKKRSKEIQLIINKSGIYKVYLCYANEDDTYTPVVSFKIKMQFDYTRCIRVPK